jgi:putative transposase
MHIAQQKSRSRKALCLLLGYSRQAYYQQKTASEQGILQEELVIQEVLRLRSRQKKIGTRKLQLLLQPFLSAHHLQIGRDALFELLADHKLLIRKRRRRVPQTTFSGHWLRKHPNLIVGMPVLKPNVLWVSDITYITLKDDFAYLSLVTDAYSRLITGYHLSKNLLAEGCVKALKMALKQLPENNMLIHHSDRGSQYCSTEYVEQLQNKHIAISMTQHSDPRENAIAERVNGILKQELLEVSYSSFEQAREGIKSAINIYNHERPHSSVDMLTPFQAHSLDGELKRHWKNYYRLNKERRLQEM